MFEAGVDAQAAIENPDLLPFTGRTGEKLRVGIHSLSEEDVVAGRERAEEQLGRADELSATILVHGDPRYPARVYASNNPVPVLYVRGYPKIWDNAGTVAIVGSRSTREPYASAARQFARVAVQMGMVVVSGFAMGADSMGHRAAVDAGGRTVCVMPCGLDKVFPPENRRLWEELLACSGAVFVSEFGFGQRASSLLLRKRNKLIVAFAQGVLVAQSAVTGGAMNAYRFGREQKKPVATFITDGSKGTGGNALIEEDERTGGFVFEPTSNLQRQEAWLQQLSSWI
jgi:DNA processing protein